MKKPMIKVNLASDQYGNMDVTVDGKNLTSQVKGVQFMAEHGKLTNIMMLMADGAMEASLEGAVQQHYVTPEDRMDSLLRAAAWLRATDAQQLTNEALEAQQWDEGGELSIVQAALNIMAQRFEREANELGGNPEVRGSEHEGHVADPEGSASVG